MGHQEEPVGGYAALNGILVVDKPKGWTSMDVIRKVRISARRGVPGLPKRFKVGHCGTLDPLATGVLVVCLGKATKLVETLMADRKVYEATIDLSAFTASDDAELPREVVEVHSPPTLEDIRAGLDRQVGDIQQVPPAYSAVHVDGKRAYKLARSGQAVKLKAKPVTVEAIEVLAYAWPVLRVRITSGKGVYIRSIARDLGKYLGTGGHLTALCRTQAGEFTLAMAQGIERFESPIDASDLLRAV